MSNIPPGQPPQPPGGGSYPPPGGQPPPGGYGPPPGEGYGPPPGYGQPAYGAPQGGGMGGAQLATWGERVISYFIEFGPFILLSVVGRAAGAAVYALVQLLSFAWSIYNAYLNGATGQSVGKRLTGLRVVSESTGQPIGGGMGILRSIAHIADAIICGIGFLFPLWDAKKQTLADKIVSTVVLSGQQKQPFSADVLKP